MTGLGTSLSQKRDTPMNKQMTVQVPVDGRAYTFHLCHRRIEFEAAGEITYYWMAIPELRKSGGGTNVRACINLWWAETLAQSLTDPEDKMDAEVNLALAELYPLIAQHRGAQDVFNDGFLKKRGSRRLAPRGKQASVHCASLEDDRELDDRESVLSDAEWKRLQTMCRRRDIDGIRQEIEAILVGELPAKQERPKYDEAFRVWMGNAVVQFEEGGRNGLRRFLNGELLPQIALYRRRGSQVRPRLFINMVSHEAKAAFHLCYTNAWSKLTPLLMKDCGLDATSARFMSLWHNQNELESGRDAFWGHILALHPLSERVMTQAHHRAAVGQWLSVAQDDPLAGPIVDRDEYWDLVATILAASHEYAHLREQANAARRLSAGALPSSSRQSAAQPAPDREQVAALFDQYATEVLLTCQTCSGSVSYVDAKAGTGGGAVVTYVCDKCGKTGAVDLGTE